MLVETFVGQEEEYFVLNDGAAEVCAEIIALEGSLGQQRARCVLADIEEVSGIEIVIAEEFKQFAVVFIRPGTGGQVDDGAGVPAILRWERGIVDFVFGERV